MICGSGLHGRLDCWLLLSHATPLSSVASPLVFALPQAYTVEHRYISKESEIHTELSVNLFAEEEASGDHYGSFPTLPLCDAKGATLKWEVGVEDCKGVP